jgi:crotonobetainyl-CoA:carnitine CoA-transferase CaiB-like acyl-CoA transferase
VLTPQQALDDPQVKAMGLLTAVAGYPGLPRPALVSGLPIGFTRMDGGIRSDPPTSGEHSREILASLGFSAVEIQGFIQAGVVS